MDPLNHAIEIVKKLTHAGHIAYFAGGWVRDHLMKHDSFDIDIATDAPPEKILDLFPQTILVGLAFGVVIVTVGGHQFEVATLRKDFGYSDGRKPDKIEYSDPRGDAFRRDFTINGMFYDPLAHVIHDFVDGAEDLQKEVIRAIGNPYERFMEDRLRMIRAVRFASRFSFSIDPETDEAIRANADKLFPSVAMERVWAEFKKMSECPHFGHALVELHRLGLLPVIFPELKNEHLNEIKKHSNVFKLLPEGTPTALYLCHLFPSASLQELTDIFKRLHVSNQDLKLVEAVVSARKYFAPSPIFTSFQWAHFYAHPHTSLLIEAESAKHSINDRDAFLHAHVLRKASLEQHIERIKQKKPVVTAAYLKEMGITPGVGMGTLLKEAEQIAINQDLHDPQVVLQRLRESSNWHPKGII